MIGRILERSSGGACESAQARKAESEASEDEPAGGMELSTAYPQIPYGWADFEAMRRERTLYVDKTRFLHDLERGAVRIRDPPAPLRQVVLGGAAGELLRPQPRRPVRGDLRRHRHRPAADGQSPPLRGPALRLLRVRRHPGDPARALRDLLLHQAPPRELIDANVRIDYGKLRHLLTVNRQLNGNFDLLRHLIGEGSAAASCAAGFR